MPAMAWRRRRALSDGKPRRLARRSATPHLPHMAGMISTNTKRGAPARAGRAAAIGRALRRAFDALRADVSDQCGAVLLRRLAHADPTRFRRLAAPLRWR